MDCSSGSQMLVGVVAFNVLDVVPAREERAVGVLLTGYVFQGEFAVLRDSRGGTAPRPGLADLCSAGLGFFVTFFYICIYLIR